MKTLIPLTRLACSVLLSVYLVSLLFCGSSQASWTAVPLKERIKAADLVVVGKLTDVKPKYFSVTQNMKKYYPDSSDYSEIYDIGYIHVEKILKGSHHEGALGLAFDHANQPKNPFRHMKYSYSEGQYGIWIVSRGDVGPAGGYFYVQRPDNFLEADKLREVERAVKTIESEVGSNRKIIVRERPNSDEGYVAYFDGEEAWTKTFGRSKYEAVGSLMLMQENAANDLGFDFEVHDASQATGDKDQDTK